MDALYMEAVQGMTGHGGWPLNVFLTPEGLPFYGGTYFPPAGAPRDAVVLAGAAGRRRSVERARRGDQRERRADCASGCPAEHRCEPSERRLSRRLRSTRRSSGWSSPSTRCNGGFGGAPKFPQASVFEFLMCRAAAHEHNLRAPPPTDGRAIARRRMALYTLRAMAGGGIHDQVGGGFHRYAVDATWTVPHFEKMLYDNALLARAYLHGFQLSGERDLLEVCQRHARLGAARDARPRGRLLQRAWTPTPTAWRVASMYGRSGSCERSSARTPMPRSAGWARASRATSWTRTIPQPGLNVLEDRGPRPDETTRARIRAQLLDARGASAPDRDSTTSA